MSGRPLCKRIENRQIFTEIKWKSKTSLKTTYILKSTVPNQRKNKKVVKFIQKYHRPNMTMPLFGLLENQRQQDIHYTEKGDFRKS